MHPRNSTTTGVTVGLMVLPIVGVGSRIGVVSCVRGLVGESCTLSGVDGDTGAVVAEALQPEKTNSRAGTAMMATYSLDNFIVPVPSASGLLNDM